MEIERINENHLDNSSTFGLRLEPHQETLIELFRGEGERFADWYIASLYVLADQKIPCRCMLASQPVREILEKIAEKGKVDGKKGGSKFSTNGEIKNFMPEWEKLDSSQTTAVQLLRK